LESLDDTTLNCDEVIGTRSDTAGSPALVRRLDADEDVRSPSAIEDLDHLKPPVVAPEFHRPVVAIKQ